MSSGTSSWPGSLFRLDYGLDELTERFKNRDEGFLYVTETCFGRFGPWAGRPGWQPIADAVSGLAWGHGMALQEHVSEVFGMINTKGLQPALLPFLTSDYGTGAIGTVGAFLALYKCAAEGGSYKVDVSLVGWNLWVQGLRELPDDVQDQLFKDHERELNAFKINHSSNLT